jgi:ureidoacrylate peracid hydrolase
MVHRDYTADPNGPFGIAEESWLQRDSLAFLIVDMQNYMTDRGYSSRWSADGAEEYYFTRCQEVVLPNILRISARCREGGVPVVYLRIAYRDPDLADVPAGVCRKRLAEELFDRRGRPYRLHFEDDASQIDARISPLPGDIVVEKTSSGASCSSQLDLVLRSRGVSRLIFSGGLTDGCVESTVRQAFDRGYLCAVVEDACVTSRREYHEASLTAMRNYFAWITNTERVVEAIRGE